jgi:hypothetical protein
MTISSVANGTQTATISTEHTLNSPSGPATYVLVVDTTNMVNGDTLELRCKTKAKAAGSAIQYVMATYVNVQSDPLKMSIPVPSVDGGTFTLKQTAGTGRAFDWNLYAL